MLPNETMELIRMTRTLREAFERGEKRGVKTGEKKGVERMLRRLFLRRLQRPLTDQEELALVDRVRVLDPEEVEDRALSLEGEALAAWLLDPNAR